MNIDHTQIKEGLAVRSKDGMHVGTVDHMEGENQIKLKKMDSPDGKHHFLPVDLVEKVDFDGVYLSVNITDVRDQMKDEDDFDGNVKSESDSGMDINQRTGNDRGRMAS